MKINKNRLKRRKGRFLLPIFAALLFIIVLVLISGLFFEITDIQVEGIIALSREEIIEAAGFSFGDSIFLINRTSGAHALRSSFPYVRDVRFRRQLPGRVIIEITEATPVAIIAHRDNNWLMDNYGTLLEITERGENLPRIIGFLFGDPVLGTRILAHEDDAAKTEPMLELLTVMLELEMLGEVGEIDLSRISNITFTFRDIYTAEIGEPLYFRRKLETMLLSLEDDSIIAAGPGTFFLSDAGERQIRFVPDR